MPTKPTPKKLNVTQRKVNASWNSTDFKYNSVEWIKLRNLVRMEEPLCRTCKAKGELTPTKVVDHIRPISQGGDPWDRENLQGLCETCHNTKTAKEKQNR